jgi:hypothetical protein
VSGFKAFREAYISGGHVRTDIITDDFGDFDARRLRYDIFWAHYENTAYRNLHKWAQSYRTSYGLYEWIRNIYNPSYRLGEFYKSHIMGGELDPQAGDGKSLPTALPILIPQDNQANEVALRAAIAQIWSWSNLQIRKDLMTLWGTIFGDVFLAVRDDTGKGQVYLDVIHPGTVADLITDDRGNVKAYTIKEYRVDDAYPTKRSLYTERATREGDNVVYETLKDGQPYAWSPNGQRWTVPYGFVPMVAIKHNDVGLEWGWSELQAGLSKIMEIDDMASKLDDHIRKMVDPMWLIAGVSKPKPADIERGKTTPTTDRPQPGREEVPALWANNPQAKPYPLVSQLNIEFVVGALKNLSEEIEKDYPELQVDMWRAIQTNSGRALRLARQPAESKVGQRRPNYDDGLVRAQQMAIAIAGYRGLEGFGGFGLDSYRVGDLEHRIGKRSVFAHDPLDDLEIEKSFWSTAEQANKAGVRTDAWLRKQGWSEEAIKALFAEGAAPPSPPEIAEEKNEIAQEQTDNFAAQAEAAAAAGANDTEAGGPPPGRKPGEPVDGEPEVD